MGLFQSENMSAFRLLTTINSRNNSFLIVNVFGCFMDETVLNRKVALFYAYRQVLVDEGVIAYSSRSGSAIPVQLDHQFQ